MFGKRDEQIVMKKKRENDSRKIEAKSRTISAEKGKFSKNFHPCSFFSFMNFLHFR